MIINKQNSNSSSPDGSENPVVVRLRNNLAMTDCSKQQEKAN
jgi:hypothetical protein